MGQFNSSYDKQFKNLKHSKLNLHSKKYYLEGESSDDQGSTGCTPSDTDRLTLNYDSDEEIIELGTMYSKDKSFTAKEERQRDNVTKKLSRAAPAGIISNKMKAVIFINIYCIFDTVDNINAKSATSKGVDFLDLAFSRVALNFVSACFFVYYFQQKIFAGIPREFVGALTYRSVMMLFGQTLNCFAIQLLPLSMMTIVQNTQAFWTVLLGYMINNEKFLRIEMVGILACFCGVVMMAVSEEPDQGSEGQSNIHSGVWQQFGRLIGVLVMVFVAFNDGLLAVMARSMKSIHFSLMMFWFSAIGMAILIVYLSCSALITQTIPRIFTYSFDQMYNLVLTGIFSALNLTCLTIAYQNDKSATVSLLAYIALVYAFLADTMIFNHNFVFLELTGAMIITSFNLFTIVYKMLYAPDSEDEEGSSQSDYEFLDIKDEEECIELNEDFQHNQSWDEMGFENKPHLRNQNKSQNGSQRPVGF